MGGEEECGRTACQWTSRSIAIEVTQHLVKDILYSNFWESAKNTPRGWEYAYLRGPSFISILGEVYFNFAHFRGIHKLGSFCVVYALTLGTCCGGQEV